jgi:hypothetical protein
MSEATSASTEREKWVAEIDAAEKALKKFHERGNFVTKRFLDERDTLNSGSKWFNLFYANTNILESALYSQLPKPIVSRRFKDYDDEIGRVASMVLQRSITQDLDDPRDQFDSTLRQCVQDRLVSGLSQAWLRLETDTEEIDDIMPEPQPGTEAPPPESSMQRIKDQRVCVDYVYWADFLWSPCRVWSERRWTGRRVYMDRESLVKRFGDVKGNAVSLDFEPKMAGRLGAPATPQDTTIQKAVVYEIWVRETRQVIWFARGYGELLDVKDDPLGLVGFEPCPTPMLGNTSTSNTVPRPDYYMLQDQYSELDTVNHRISMLVQACKVVGVYDKGSPAIGRMLKEGFDNDLIPADNWAMFAEKGGVKGQVDWLPLETIVAALNQLNMAREAIKAQIYELTGISDIVRGASKASETLGAQEIKAKFASVRIKKLQDEVARFAAEVLRIKAEIQVKHFTPEILKRNSNIESTPDAPLADQAIELLQSEDGFEWRVTVTADSIAQADYDMEKRDRVEFLTAVSSYLEKASTMFQAVPQSATLLVGMLKWAVAGFRNASEIEGMMDKALDELEKAPPQDKPDPEQMRLQMEQQRVQGQQQVEMQKAQMDQQMEQQRFAMEQQKAQMDMQHEQQMAQIKLQMEQQKLALMEREMQMKLQFEQAMAELKMGVAQQQSAQKLQASQEQHEMQMEAAEEAAENEPKGEKDDS